LTPNAERSNWTEKVLYAFCKQGGKVGADGANPHSGVSFAFGGLLGNADSGGGAYSDQAAGAPGAGSGGNVFLLTPGAVGAPWTFKVLYSFCAKPNCADGGGGGNAVTIDRSGNIYSGTYLGGANGMGVIFELSP
jgi:hypothetical protein